jgi:hypothetical protein
MGRIPHTDIYESVKVYGLVSVASEEKIIFVFIILFIFSFRLVWMQILILFGTFYSMVLYVLHCLYR